MNPKEHIIQVAEDLFFRKGFHLTTIRDIARAADINVSMINYHFKSKEGLYLRIFEKLDVLLTVFNDVENDPSQNTKALNDFVVKTWSAASIHPKIVYLFLIEELQPSTDMIKIKISHLQKFHFEYFLQIAAQDRILKKNEGRLLYATIFGPTKEFFKLTFFNKDSDFCLDYIKNEFSDLVSKLLDKICEV